MTAATVTTKVYEKGQAVPGQEVVVLTLSSGETYTAKTLARVDAAVCTWQEAVGTAPEVTSISGATVTITATGVSDKKICLVCYGV